MVFGLRQQPTDTDNVTGRAIQPPAQIPNTVSSSPAQTNVGAPLINNSGAAGGGAVSYPDSGPGSKPGAGLELGPVEAGQPYTPQHEPFDPMQKRGSVGNKVRDTVYEDPNKALAAGEQASSTARQTVDNADDNAGQIKGLNKQLNITDKTQEQFIKEVEVGLRRAVEDKQITPEQAKKYKKGWRRIFNHISEDEMGLFLMDFGLRAMMAGETMGDMGALGAAGSGALGALQGRRQLARENELELQQTAHEIGTDKYQNITERMKAEASKTTAAAKSKQADTPYTGRDTWREQYFKEAGYSKEERARIAAGGQEVSNMVMDQIQRWQDRRAEQQKIEGSFGAQGGLPRKMQTVPSPDGTTKQVPIADLSQADIRALALESVKNVLQDAEGLRRGSMATGALQGNAEAPAEVPTGQKNKTAEELLEEQRRGST